MKTELVTTLKREATKVLKELREQKEPVLITEHGKPSAYLVDVEHFEALQKKYLFLKDLPVVKKPYPKVELYQTSKPKNASPDG